MAQQAYQPAGGVFTDATLDAMVNNTDDLYSYYGVAAGNPWSVNRFVDGTHGSDASNGLVPSRSFKTIQAAINASGQGDRVFIRAMEAESASGDTDPDSYTEALTITGKDGLQLIGVGRGLAQGGQPQLKIGATTTSPIITVNAFGVGIHNLTINGAGATGGGVLLNANGSTADAGGAVISGCHFKNCKGSAAAASGGAIYWSANGGAWYVSIYNNEFIDCRAGVSMPGTSVSVPQHVKIVGNRFSCDPNTDDDCDIYVGGSGIKNLIVDRCLFGTVDVPAYATSPDAARYIELATGTTGIISNCVFACISDSTGSEKTFGASGTAVIAPTTVRIAACWGEGLVASAHLALVGRT